MAYKEDVAVATAAGGEFDKPNSILNGELENIVLLVEKNYYPCYD